MIDAGFVALVISFLSSSYSTTLFVSGILYGNSQKLSRARESMHFAFLTLTISVSILLYYFLADNYSVEYVYRNSSSDLQILYKISALWAGSEGSLLLWTWLLSIVIILFLYFEVKDLLTAGAVVVLILFLDFLLFILIYSQNPFELLSLPPSHGLGLNPLLESHEMVFHPTALFVGYSLAIVPFSLAISGLIFDDESWVYRARKWLLLSWIFLTAGISIGAFWAYRVLGWGGFWAWDPVENASLLPWLTTTALLHSIMIQEARKGMKKWNILLSFATVEFVLLGTLITRSGIIASVHAFGMSGLSLPFTILMVVLLVITVFLIFKQSVVSRDVIENLISRETSFLLNNLLFSAFALTVFWGTIFPLFTEAFLGYKAVIGEKYYLQTVTPIAYMLATLSGFCVVLEWRVGSRGTLRLLIFASLTMLSALLLSATSVFGFRLNSLWVLTLTISLFAIFFQILQYIRDAKVFRREYGNLSFVKVLILKRRRYGGYTVHLGVILIFLGVAGNWIFAEEREVLAGINDEITVMGYSFVYKGLEQGVMKDRVVFTAYVEVTTSKGVEVVKPRIERFKLQSNEISRVAILRDGLVDVYISLMSFNKDSVGLRIKFNPFVPFIWVGSLIMLSGGVFALTPKHIARRLLEAVDERCKNERVQA